MKNSKRILSVTIKCEADESPDSSYLGEYSNYAKSSFSIDRKHALDCNLNSLAAKQGAALLHRICDKTESESEAETIVCDLLSEMQDCSCGGGNWIHHQLRYFNPSFNYVNSKGEIVNDLTPEQVEEYTHRDYERMESLNAGNWRYIGIQAKAIVQLTAGGPNQTISSGGLWGIESDSGKDYFAEVEGEELAELRNQLQALGFSSRAVSKAIKEANRN